MKEIERKFLVNTHSWKQGLTEIDSSLIQQGYLNADPERVVRIRIRDMRAFVTIKGRTLGFSRAEYEYPIPVDDARELLEMCIGKVLMKRRYEIKYKDSVWEVDEFLGPLDGLVLAEIELTSEEDTFDTPDWIGEEVSHYESYSNMWLALH